MSRARTASAYGMSKDPYRSWNAARTANKAPTCGDRCHHPSQATGRPSSDDDTVAACRLATAAPAACVVVTLIAAIQAIKPLDARPGDLRPRRPTSGTERAADDRDVHQMRCLCPDDAARTRLRVARMAARAVDDGSDAVHRGLDSLALERVTDHKLDPVLSLVGGAA